MATWAQARAATASAAPSTTGRLLVLMDGTDAAHPATAAATARAVVARAGARASGPAVPQIGLVTVRPRRGESLDRLAARLRDDPRVASVQTEHRYRPRLVPDDPALTLPAIGTAVPAGTSLEWWAARENLFAAWDVTRGNGALVAVIDTGVDAGHPDLAGRVVRTMDFDDLDSGPASVDEQGHGTHVASIACAAAGNGIGIAGAGYGCSLLVIKSDLTDASVAKSLVAATDAGADAINMSFGNDGAAPAAAAVVKAIDYAYKHKVPMVAAAADEPVAEQGDPANVLQPTGTGSLLNSGKGLTVTVADFNDRRASFAGHGSQISIAAYGSFESSGGQRGILGAFPAAPTTLESSDGSPPCGCRTTLNGDDRYAYLRGTSMGAPMVAAIAALAKHLNPDLSAGDVARILKRTARRPAGTGWNPELGWGILDGGAALYAARALDRTRPVSTLSAPAVVRTSTFLLRFSGRDPAPAGLTPSGIDHYEVWRSTNGAPAVRIAVTTETSLRVRADPGVNYRFFTRAYDRAGNRERHHKQTVARVRVVRSVRGAARSAAVDRAVPAARTARFDATAAMSLISRQVAVGQRPAGSAQLRTLAERLRALLPGGRFESVPGWPRLRNVVGSLPGKGPAIVVGAHYDTLTTPKGFVGANNGAAGSAIVIGVARALRAMKRPADAPPIRFVLFDGEEPPDGLPEDQASFATTGLRGSRADAARNARSTRAMILLDYVGGRGLRLPREAGSDRALWERVRAAAARVGVGAVFPAGVQGAITDDHSPYLDRGVPAVDLIDWTYPGHSLQDGMDLISPRAVDAVGETITELLRAWR